MTYNTFKSIFLTKYPNGNVGMHGKGTKCERVLVVFEKGQQVYEYSGAYDSILEHCGIKVISKAHYSEIEQLLQTAIARNGKKSMFGGTIDSTKDIEKYSALLADYDNNFIVV